MTGCSTSPTRDCVSALRSSLSRHGLRMVRLVSFASLTPVARHTDRHGWFDTEMTKPLHLGELHEALSGDAPAATAFTAANGAPSAGAWPRSRGQSSGGRRSAAEPRSRRSAYCASLGVRLRPPITAREALEKLRAGRFDVVLMDCEMPVMDGFTATARAAPERAGRERIAGHRPHRRCNRRGPRGMPRGRHGRLPGETLHARGTACRAGSAGWAARPPPCR